MKLAPVFCPTCKRMSKSGELVRNTLGALDEFGNFIIIRNFKNVTMINGSDFTVYCDLCNQPVFFRKEADAGTGNWEPRVFRQSYSIEIGTLGLGSN